MSWPTIGQLTLRDVVLLDEGTVFLEANHNISSSRHFYFPLLSSGLPLLLAHL